MEIAAGDTGTADEDLTGDADGHGLQVGVQQVDLVAGHRCADGCAPVGVVGSVKGEEGGADGSLRGAIAIDDVQVGGQVAEALQGLLFDGLDADQETAQGQGRVQCGQVAGHSGQQGGRDVGAGDAMGDQIVGQGLGSAKLLGAQHVQRAAEAESGEELPDGDVEAIGGHRGGGELPTGGGGLFETVQQGHDVAVLDHHAFRLPGRARGVQHVSQVGRRGCAEGVFLRLLADRGCLGVQADDAAIRGQGGQPRQQRLLGEQQGSGGVFQHEGQTLPRIGGVQRQVGCASFEDAQDGHDHGQRAFQADGDDRFWANAELLEVVRQLIGAPVQLVIGPLSVCDDQGHTVGRAGGLGLEDLVDALVGRIGEGDVVPVQQQVLPFGRGQDGQGGDVLVGMGDDALQQGLEMAGHALDSGRLEQVGVVGEQGGEALLAFDEE